MKIKEKVSDTVQSIANTAEKKAPDVQVDIQSLPITTVSDFKKTYLNIRKIKVPSGAVFLVKNINLLFMISRGILPLPILMSMAKLHEKDISVVDNSTEKITEFITDDEFKTIDKMISAVTIEAVIEPPITEEDTENSIQISSIDFIDKMFIFSECVKGGNTNYEEFFRPI